MIEPRVLITRPTGQHAAFAQSCEKLGFAVSLLPCLRIQTLEISEQHLAEQLSNSQTILFTSANAVRIAHQIYPLPWTGNRIHAIGAATARCLEQNGQPLSLVPQSPFNSEAYLAQLEKLPSQSLLIIKGQDGRGVIQPELESRGWQVSSLDLYKRVKPTISTSIIDKLFRSAPPDIISVTSDDILNNLWQLCQGHEQYIRTIPLVVNSQRCATRAAALGFIVPALVAQPPGDTGQLSCLLDWMNTVFKYTAK